MTAGFNIRMPAEPRCWMCDTDAGLRICSQDPWGGNTEYVCADCFKGSDTGPCFDDLRVAEQHWHPTTPTREALMIALQVLTNEEKK